MEKENISMEESVAAPILKEAFSGSFKGALLFSWIIVHWKVVYVTLFVSQDKLSKLKHEYIRDIYTNNDVWWWHPILTFIYVLVLTFIIIFLVQPFIISRFFFAKTEKNRIQRMNIRNRLELEEAHEKEKKVAEIIRERLGLEQEKGAVIKKQEENLQKKKELAVLNPKIMWEDEYDEFKKLDIFLDFNQIIESYYSKRGSIEILDWNGNPTWVIDPHILAYADGAGLITLSTENDKIHLTEKGKYFMERYAKEMKIDRKKKDSENNDTNSEGVPF